VSPREAIAHFRRSGGRTPRDHEADPSRGGQTRGSRDLSRRTARRTASCGVVLGEDGVGVERQDAQGVDPREARRRRHVPAGRQIALADREALALLRKQEVGGPALPPRSWRSLDRIYSVTARPSVGNTNSTGEPGPGNVEVIKTRRPAARHGTGHRPLPRARSRRSGRGPRNTEAEAGLATAPPCGSPRRRRGLGRITGFASGRARSFHGRPSGAE
jgi:hypothetical protein